MTTQHWLPPDIRSDILAAAMRSDAAEPVAIHVRPEMLARMGTQPLGSDPTGATGSDTTNLPTGILLVVDDRLPRTPGYEVYRVAPQAPVGMRPEIEAVGGDLLAEVAASPVAAPCAVRPAGRQTHRGTRPRQLRLLLGHRTHHQGRRLA
jgi:hypothetical protein